MITSLQTVSLNSMGIPTSKLAANVCHQTIGQLVAVFLCAMLPVVCGVFQLKAPFGNMRNKAMEPFIARPRLNAAKLRPARVQIPAIYPLHHPPVTRHSEMRYSTALLCELVDSQPSFCQLTRKDFNNDLIFQSRWLIYLFVAHYIPR